MAPSISFLDNYVMKITSNKLHEARKRKETNEKEKRKLHKHQRYNLKGLCHGSPVHFV